MTLQGGSLCASTFPAMVGVIRHPEAGTLLFDTGYQAVVLQSGYRVRDNLTVNGHYTLQLRNHGNVAGEAPNQPGIPSIYGNLLFISEDKYDSGTGWPCQNCGTTNCSRPPAGMVKIGTTVPESASPMTLA